jgi:hypothetical protein
MDRFLNPRHVAFWSVLGSMAAVIALIVTLTATSSSAGKAAGASSATPDAGAAGNTPAAGASSGQAGTELTSYDVTVPVGYGIDLAGSPSRPVNLANGSEADLEYLGGVYLEVGTSGQISEPSAASPGYKACLNDTAYTTKVLVPATGTTVCFTGSGVIAAAVIKDQVTAPVQSITFAVTVWKR